MTENEEEATPRVPPRDAEVMVSISVRSPSYKPQNMMMMTMM